MRKIPFIIAVALCVCLAPCVAFAFQADDQLQAADVIETQADNIAEGMWGSCPWEISADGVLTVHPGEAVDPEPGQHESVVYPWQDHVKDIKAIVFAEEDGQKVIAPSIIRYLCAGSNVKTVDCSGLDTSNATDMSCMFSPCESLESVNLSGLNTSNVTTMYHMFWKCGSLKSVDLSSFDTSNVTNMGQMFDQCAMESIDVSSFDTSKVTFMVRMFSGCSSLTSLDLSSFDTTNVEYMSEIFSGCRSLKTIYVGSGWNAANVKGGHVFKSCTSLVGGAGTVYNDEHIGADYARIDGGPESDTPGYLTYKRPEQLMHRLYNPNSGEHFYTADEGERAYLTEIGWAYEGVGWTAPAKSDMPVYRLYNRGAGDHHYTLDANERAYLISVGWEDENIGWYSAGEDGVPLYRQFNPNATGAGSHNYTADANERDWLVNNGWNDEGIGWYGIPADA